MAEIFSWDGDGLANGPMTTSSAGPGDTAPTAILGATAPQITTGGLHPPRLSFVPSPATDQCGARWDYTATAEVGVRFYFTTAATLPASGQQPHIFWLSDGTGYLLEIDYTSTGRINLRDSAAVLDQTPTATITTDTTYRIELTVDHSTGSVVLNLYQGESTTPLDTLTATSANLGAQSTQTSFGKLNSATSPTHFLDSLLVLDEAVMPGPVPPTGTTRARGGRLSGSVPEGTLVARGSRLTGALPATFAVSISSADDLERAEPGTTVTLTAAATGGTVTAWTWSAPAGITITPAGNECAVYVPATLYGQNVSITATATGTGASPGASTVVVQALPHNEWITSPTGWQPLLSSLI